jgi:hypothetical protein
VPIPLDPSYPYQRYDWVTPNDYLPSDPFDPNATPETPRILDPSVYPGAALGGPVSLSMYSAGFWGRRRFQQPEQRLSGVG